MADWGREEGKPDPAIVQSASGRATVLSLCAAALFSLPTAVYLHYYEGGASNQFFVWSVTLTLGAWIVLAFRRVLVASVLVNALVGLIATASWAKQQAMDMALHAYDVVFYLSSWATIDYLWNGFRLHVVALVAGVLAIAIAAGVAYRLDATRVSRGSALIASLVLTIAAGVAFHENVTQAALARLQLLLLALVVVERLHAGRHGSRQSQRQAAGRRQSHSERE